MCGCLARIGSDRIFGELAGIEDSGEIVNQSFFSNIFGSFVLGKCKSKKNVNLLKCKDFSKTISQISPLFVLIIGPIGCRKLA